MPLKLYAHPFSSYCQKVLIALYENDIPFEYRQLTPEEPQNMETLARLWPFKRFPVLEDGDRAIAESSVIIEYLHLSHRGPVALLPEDDHAAVEVRFMDRFFDLDIMTPQAKVVIDCLRPEDSRDPFGVSDAQQRLETAYRWLDTRLKGRTWAAGDAFSLADCAAAPALFYADWTHPIDPGFANVHAYRQRLLRRPSFARAVEEARPYRPLFPLGAPDRD
ncbi:glutathione S-transferase family protein [Microbulbifer sp. SAOS-129_SWC]|uniref:glutathione S-transferase family protein n=1 Tax=Microbulbifer sp. SAOS-129_SWC TaxID=3145235 RepID=UPI00321647AF